MRSIGSGTSRTCSEKSTSRSSARSSFRTASAFAPVRRMFWATVRSGTSAGSWKTGARPFRAACAGEPMRTTLPLIETAPRSAAITPVSTLTSVLLPAPFAPSSACTSPGATTRSAERSACTAP